MSPGNAHVENCPLFMLTTAGTDHSRPLQENGILTATAEPFNVKVSGASELQVFTVPVALPKLTFRVELSGHVGGFHPGPCGS